METELDNPITSTVYEAGKPFTMAGKEYKRGDVVDVSNLTKFKIGQMLNQRFLAPHVDLPPEQPT